jgi:hypothetical protein
VRSAAGCGIEIAAAEHHGSVHAQRIRYRPEVIGIGRTSVVTCGHSLTACFGE